MHHTKQTKTAISTALACAICAALAGTAAAKLSFERFVGVQPYPTGEVAEPGGIATDAAGNAYVTNQIRRAVQVYTADGIFVREFSIDRAVGDGRASVPEGVAVDATGRIFVADAKRTSVLVFDTDGRYRRRIGGSRVKSVGDLAVDSSGRILVPDPARRRIHVFTRNGRFVRAIGGKSTLSSLEGIDIDATGDVYAVDWRRNSIQRFSPTGTLISTLRPADASMQPVDVAVGASGAMFVADAHGFVVRILDATGATVGSFSQADFQSRVGLGPDGSVYVAEDTYGLANRYSAAGVQLATFGRHVPNPADVGAGDDVAATPTGGVAVAREDTGTIAVFDVDGNLLRTLAGPAGPQGDAFSPRTLAVNNAGGVAVLSVQKAAFPGDEDQYLTEFDALGGLLSNTRLTPFDEGSPFYKMVGYNASRTMTLVDWTNGSIESFTVAGGSLAETTPSFGGRATNYTTYAALIEPQGDVVFANHKSQKRHIYALSVGAGSPSRIDRLGRRYRNWEFTDISEDSAGNIYLLCRRKNRVLKLRPNGKLAQTIRGSSRSKPGSRRLGNISAIAAARDGVLYVADEYGVKKLSE